MSPAHTRRQADGARLARMLAALLLAMTFACAPAISQQGSPSAAPDAQIPPPPLSPLTQHVDAPNAPAPQITAAMNSTVQPSREDAHGLSPRFLGFLGPYRRPVVPPLFAGSQARLQTLIRDGKLYLTLQDAIALALENNLDLEAERYNLVLARTDAVRAAGGGNLRGIDYTVNEPPNGVGGPGSPLLAAETTNSNPTAPTVTDLTSLNSTAQTQLTLSQTPAGFQYAPGPNIPLFDPQLIGDAGYLRRSNTVTLTTTGGASSGIGTGAAGAANQPQPLNFATMNFGYVEGFSTGAQLQAVVNNDAEVIYGARSKYDPFYSPSTSVTLTQPLLRGRGRAVSLRFLRIARTNQKISRLLFEQQVLDTIYGVSRLYFDLVSLGENVLVKQEALRAATRLRQDDQDQVQLGTLAPIELTRAQALESSSRFDLIQAQGLYKQQEIILKNQLLRTASPVFTAQFDQIDAERDKLSVGQSTDLAVLQDEAYLAQARSTEIAARSNWKKAHIELDHALGDLLEKNHIVVDDAIRGTLP